MEAGTPRGACSAHGCSNCAGFASQLYRPALCLSCSHTIDHHFPEWERSEEADGKLFYVSKRTGKKLFARPADASRALATADRPGGGAGAPVAVPHGGKVGAWQDFLAQQQAASTLHKALGPPPGRLPPGASGGSSGGATTVRNPASRVAFPPLGGMTGSAGGGGVQVTSGSNQAIANLAIDLSSLMRAVAAGPQAEASARKVVQPPPPPPAAASAEEGESKGGKRVSNPIHGLLAGSSGSSTSEAAAASPETASASSITTTPLAVAPPPPPAPSSASSSSSSEAALGADLVSKLEASGFAAMVASGSGLDGEPTPAPAAGAGSRLSSGGTVISNPLHVAPPPGLTPLATAPLASARTAEPEEPLTPAHTTTNPLAVAAAAPAPPASSASSFLSVHLGEVAGDPLLVDLAALRALGPGSGLHFFDVRQALEEGIYAPRTLVVSPFTIAAVAPLPSRPGWGTLKWERSIVSLSFLATQPLFSGDAAASTAAAAAGLAAGGGGGGVGSPAAASGKGGNRSSGIFGGLLSHFGSGGSGASSGAAGSSGDRARAGSATAASQLALATLSPELLEGGDDGAGGGGGSGGGGVFSRFNKRDSTGSTAGSGAKKQRAGSVAAAASGGSPSSSPAPAPSSSSPLIGLLAYFAPETKDSGAFLRVTRAGCSPVEFSGWAHKRKLGTWREKAGGLAGMGWKKRWLALDGGSLKYYSSQPGRAGDESGLKGSIPLQGAGWVEVAKSGASSGDRSAAALEPTPCSFVIRTEKTLHAFYVDDEDTCDAWVAAIALNVTLAGGRVAASQNVILQSPAAAETLAHAIAGRHADLVAAMDPSARSALAGGAKLTLDIVNEIIRPPASRPSAAEEEEAAVAAALWSEALGEPTPGHGSAATTATPSSGGGGGLDAAALAELDGYIAVALSEGGVSEALLETVPPQYVAELMAWQAAAEQGQEYVLGTASAPAQPQRATVAAASAGGASGGSRPRQAAAPSSQPRGHAGVIATPTGDLLALDAPSPAHSTSGGAWLYIDNEERVQGPFPTAAMRSWLLSGFFMTDTLIRSATPLGNLAEGASALVADSKGVPQVFLPVSVLFPDPQTAFLDEGWAPRYLHATKYNELIAAATDLGIDPGTAVAHVLTMQELGMPPELGLLLDMVSSSGGSGGGGGY